jgi:hypothetical protein
MKYPNTFVIAVPERLFTEPMLHIPVQQPIQVLGLAFEAIGYFDYSIASVERNLKYHFSLLLLFDVVAGTAFESVI